MDKATYYRELAAEYVRQGNLVANEEHRVRYHELAEAFRRLAESHDAKASAEHE